MNRPVIGRKSSRSKRFRYVRQPKPEPAIRITVARLLAATLGIALTFWLVSTLVRTYNFSGPLLWIVATCFAITLVLEALAGDWSSFGTACFAVLPMVFASLYSPLAAFFTLAGCLAVGLAVELGRGTRNPFSNIKKRR